MTIQIDNPKPLSPKEWRRKIISPTGQTKFKIKYYGQNHDTYKNLIVSTDFSEPLISALDEETGEDFLLFDGCKHGYNSIFCSYYTNEQIINRISDKIYVDKFGNDKFEVFVSIDNSFDYDKEMGEDVDENGFILLDNGEKVRFEDIKRNGFDSIEIFITNENGDTTVILSEELA